MAYAVVACSRCKAPWAVELRHAKSACPRCHTAVDLARRARLWEGPSAARAREAAAAHAAALAQGITAARATELEQTLLADRPVARHDSAIDAAAAQARSKRNLGARAELVALWLTRLSDGASHAELLQALGKAGLGPERAEQEIARMLAADIIFEPRAGFYRALAD
jgi:hypothetical protein